MMKHLFNQTGALVRFILRRDRVRFPIWIISLSLITFSVALAFTDLYETEEERQAIAETMRNPAMLAMVGQGYGLDNYTNGAMMAHQMLLFTVIAVAIMNILFVARHTRADEEEGRAELILSLPTGRLANLNATILVIVFINMMLALIIGFGLYSLQIESMDLEGSLLYGIAIGAAGILFAAITALSAQLSANSRNTIGLVFTVLGISYVIRAIGDVGNETLSWFSPLGWILGAEIYVNNYWWPIILTFIIALIIMMISFYLNTIRDLESGFLTTKPGRRQASRFLQSPFALAFRIQRIGLISWAIGMFLIGASYGSVFGDLESFFEELDFIQELLTPVQNYSLTEQFITMLMTVMAMISTVPVLMAVLKLKSEENRNRIEHILSRAVSRSQLLGGYFVISVIVSVVMLSLSAIGLWLTSAAVMDNTISISTIYKAAIVYVPAIWVMTSIAVLTIGLVPKLTGLSWVYLAYSFIVVYLGQMIQVPDWLGNLSPFGHIPNVPVEDMDFLKVSLLIIIAVLFTLLGFVGYNRRDIAG